MTAHKTTPKFQLCQLLFFFSFAEKLGCLARDVRGCEENLCRCFCCFVLLFFLILINCHILPNLYPGGRVKSTDADVNCNVYCPRGGNQVRYVLTGATFLMHATRLLWFRLSLRPNHYPGPWVTSRQCLARRCSPSTVLNQAITACPDGMSACSRDARPGFTVRDS